MYYGLNSDLTLCGPFEGALDATHDVIHLRTAEEWQGLLDAVSHVAAQHPDKTQYYSINGMRIFYLGAHADKESAQRGCDEINAVVVREARLTGQQMSGDPDMADVMSDINVEEVVAALPPGRIFTVENVPAWREQLTALLQQQ